MGWRVVFYRLQTAIPITQVRLTFGHIPHASVPRGFHTHIGQKLRVVFTEGRFRKGWVTGVLGEGFWGRVQVGGGGGVFLWKKKGKGKRVGRVGGGVRTGKGTGKSMRKLCPNYPLAIYPLVFSPITGN